MAVMVSGAVRVAIWARMIHPDPFPVSAGSVTFILKVPPDCARAGADKRDRMAKSVGSSILPRRS